MRDVADPIGDPPRSIKSSLAMHHTKAFFAHCREVRRQPMQQKWRYEGDEPMSSSGPVKSERVPMAQADEDARIRRIQRAIRYGVEYADLLERFGEKDVARARRMMRESK